MPDDPRIIPLLDHLTEKDWASDLDFMIAKERALDRRAAWEAALRANCYLCAAKPDLLKYYFIGHVIQGIKSPCFSQSGWRRPRDHDDAMKERVTKEADHG